MAALFSADGAIRVNATDGKAFRFVSNFEDILWAITKRVRFVGSNYNDNAAGGPRNDELSGGRGLDTLRGHSGDDLLDGDDGADTFIFSGVGANYSVSNTYWGFLGAWWRT